MKKITFYIIVIVLSSCDNGSSNNRKPITSKKNNIGKISLDLLHRSFGTNVGPDNQLDTSNGYFLKINLSINNNDSDLLIFDSTFFQLTDETGNIYPFSKNIEHTLSGFETTLNRSQIKSNENLEGFLVFNVPTIKKYELHIYDKPFTNDSIILELKGRE